MDKIKVKRSESIRATLYRYIEDCSIATAISNALLRSSVYKHLTTIGELYDIVQASPKELLKVKGIGKTRLEALINFFKKVEIIEEVEKTVGEKQSKMYYGIRGVDVLLTNGTKLQIVAAGTNVGFIERYKGRPAGLRVSSLPDKLIVTDLCTRDCTIISADKIMYYKEKYLPIYPSEEEYEGYLPLARALLGKEEDDGRTTDI